MGWEWGRRGQRLLLPWRMSRGTLELLQILVSSLMRLNKTKSRVGLAPHLYLRNLVAKERVSRTWWMVGFAGRVLIRVRLGLFVLRRLASLLP
jgi:hypothetical protein